MIPLYYRARNWLRAFREFPKGLFCGWCGRFNTFVDDYGYWSITPVDGDTRVCCRRCYDGPLGQAHITRYGQGER